MCGQSLVLVCIAYCNVLNLQYISAISRGNIGSGHNRLLLIRALQIIALTKDCRLWTLMHEMAESSLLAFFPPLFIYLSFNRVFG